MRKVMIGTPCYDGRLDVWYVNALMNTIKMAIERDIEITPMWVSFDALLQRARNDTIHIALESGFDDLIWIDSDIEWQPEQFFKLLDYPVDVVGGTYRKKGDREEYVLRQLNKKPSDSETGLIEVDGLGTGFVKFSKSAMQHLWDVSKPYLDPKDDKERRMIFDVVIQNVDGVDQMISEDIHAFNKLKDGGFQIWLDPEITCNHIGPYKFTGDFKTWYNKPTRSVQPRPILPIMKKQL
jgi:hypothetical protein